jgi:hypothetical protein
MQRLIQIAVSDASLLPAFATSVAPTLDGLADVGGGGHGPGTWGIGEVRGGEPLVRKGPLASAATPSRLLSELRARQALYAADGAQLPRHLDERQPLRYRDWIMAASGLDTLGPGFAEAAQRRLPTYAFSQRRFPEASEAVLMLLMAALERRNARDLRDLTTRSVRVGLADGVAVIREVIAETRASETRPGLVIGLAIDGVLFFLPIDRPAWLKAFHGTGADPRPGRPPRNEHLRAIVLSDGPGLGEDATQIPLGWGIEVGLDTLPHHFRLTPG